MEKVTALHTLIRKYCIEKIEDLNEKTNEYYKITSKMSEREVIETKDSKLIKLVLKVIKANRSKDILNHILMSMEEIIPENYKSVEKLKTKIINIIESIEIKVESSKYLRENCNYYLDTEKEEINAGKTVKNELMECIEAVEDDELDSLKPMFYRRVLQKEEMDNLKERIDSKWNVGVFYDPFADSDKEDMIVFRDNFFYDDIKFNKLKEALRKIEEERIYEIRICSKLGYLMDTSAFTIFKHHYQNCSEGFWCSEKMDWIIYKFHENTITIGGEKLLEEVKNNIDNWEDGIFTYSEYEKIDIVMD